MEFNKIKKGMGNRREGVGKNQNFINFFCKKLPTIMASFTLYRKCRTTANNKTHYSTSLP
ncbi:hypothetical protein CDL12_03350 [Handroanthus impetiginosus]|uniref:Uncharacterized protein n=1 Tax=Handroanthus impetiginosus TaxID=429701 RepID=A0A2G9I2E4_9LAMI|nr:hypothetical protein CDL12_03350 [Handroanthus impetiginosus]